MTVLENLWDIIVSVDISVSINKSSPRGVVISALEVIESVFDVVVVAPIAERVPFADGGGAGAADRYVAPSVVGIGNDLRSALVPNSDDIPLQVFLEKVILEYVFRHARRAVPHPDRNMCSIIYLFSLFQMLDKAVYPVRSGQIAPYKQREKDIL